MLLNLRRSMTFAVARRRAHLRLRLPGYRSLAARLQEQGGRLQLRPTGRRSSGKTGRARGGPRPRPDDSTVVPTTPTPWPKDPIGWRQPPGGQRRPRGVRRQQPRATLERPTRVTQENLCNIGTGWESTQRPDLVTTSGSGYDPDIAPQDAIVQIPMVSRATGIAPSVLRKLIARETHGEQWGFLGSSYIVVLQLNEALAKLH